MPDNDIREDLDPADDDWWGDDTTDISVEPIDQATDPVCDDDEDDQFFFELRDSVAPDAMRAGSRAKLVFDFGMPGMRALGVVASAALENARATRTALHLHLVARGDLRVVSAPDVLVDFSEPRFRGATFELEAVRATGVDSAVRIDFLVRGTIVHQVDLRIRVLDDTEPASPSGPAPSPAHSLGTVLRSISSAPRASRRRINVWVACADRLQLTVHVVDASGGTEALQAFQAQQLDAVRLHGLCQAVQAKLAGLYGDEELWRTFDGRGPGTLDPGRVRRALAAATRQAAVAGHHLAMQLAEDPGLSGFVPFVERHRLDDDTTLTFCTGGICVPWELLYPDPVRPNPPDERDDPVDPQRFWGIRFAVETLPNGNGSLSEQRRRQLDAEQEVSLNLHARIVEGSDLRSRLDEASDAWCRRLQGDGIHVKVNRGCRAIREELQGPRASRATLIYLFCHGQPGDTLQGAMPMLQLDADCPLEPADLSRTEFACAPIVVLNSCGSGALSPLDSANFLTAFRNRGALGVVATTGSVPVSFGARFGHEIVETWLARQESLAIGLMRLRRRYATGEQPNPVPLLYALRGQLEFGPVATP